MWMRKVRGDLKKKLIRNGPTITVYISFFNLSFTFLNFKKETSLLFGIKLTFHCPSFWDFGMGGWATLGQFNLKIFLPSPFIISHFTSPIFNNEHPLILYTRGVPIRFHPIISSYFYQLPHKNLPEESSTTSKAESKMIELSISKSFYLIFLHEV